MEKTLQNYRNDTLMGELGNWNQQEAKFRELFSDHALQDREFLKMKLGEYDRIWYKYRHNVKTTDERAFLTLLQFSRRKFQKSLYPGLLTRLAVRTLSWGKAMIMQNVATSPTKTTNMYDLSSIPIPKENIEEQQGTRQTTQGEKPQSHQRYWKSDKTQRNQQHKANGPSI